MIYLKKLNEVNINNDELLDNDDELFIITKIQEHYSQDDVKRMFNKEIEEWCNDDIPDKINWYKKNGNNEASEIVVTEMIEWYENQYSKLDDNTRKNIENLILEKYSFLK